MEQNINLINFATELSTIIGRHIGLDHIHTSTNGRTGYIPAPEAGAPLLLHHYRGPFFVDIHPDDLKNIMSGKVNSHDYIYSAAWLVGYYWGGPSTIDGGYFQPMDIIGKQVEVRRYLQILSCRGHYISSGYMPFEGHCQECSLESCPFSNYKEGSWENEVEEYDPRIDFFNAAVRLLKNQIPGYSFVYVDSHGFTDDTLVLVPYPRFDASKPLSFSLRASRSLLWDLLKHKVVPENFDEYVKGFRVKLWDLSWPDLLDVTEENLKLAFDGMDHTQTKKQADVDSGIDEILSKKRNKTFVARLRKFFLRNDT